MSVPVISADAYQSLTDVEHVLLRTDMYLGPIERVIRQAKRLSFGRNSGPSGTVQMTPDELKVALEDVLHSVAEEQTFKEIIGNAADNVLRSRKAGVDPLQLEIEVTEQWVRVKNYGLHIPVAINQQTQKWAPDMIFGNLRSGSNFKDDEERMYIGKNGIGAKATNIFSLGFMIECADPVNGLLYKQYWQRNMSIRGEPEITQYSGVGYTQVSYSLDFARFGVTSFDQEALEVYGAHAAALSYVCQLPVYFNGQKIEVKSLSHYAEMFFPLTKSTSICYTDPNGAYDLCLIETPDAGMAVSFVNGMITENHGVHVDAAYRVVVANIIETLGKRAEGVRLTKTDIVNHVSVFISCRVNQPKFTSQIKDCLKSPEPKITLPEKLLQGIKKWSHLLEVINNEIERKQNNKLSKKVGGKKKGRWGKAVPANLAGTNRSNETTYILTEGDSADSYRLKFISQIPDGQGRNFYGSQPLRGKLPNTLTADFLQILDNPELDAIRNNLKLMPDTDYKDPANYRKLHYGRVLVFPDPDNDGSHVLGLVLLFFLTKYPSLVEIGYIQFLRIPRYRVGCSGQRFVFYSDHAFKRFKESLPRGADIHVEYFKGLGTSEDHHIREDFLNPRIATFRMDEKTIEKTVLAFSDEKLMADQRKAWILNWVNHEVLEVENYAELPISLFIDHELIEYSIENVIRAIPEAIDGMKESQRKAFFAAIRKLRGKGKKDKVKVAQIASHAAEITCYKHGEGCLADAIVMMTYDFVGGNNMPYFNGRGQFGTRSKGGADAANPRYTYVSLPWWTDYIFRKEDNRLEKRIIDEGEEQECENFFPILPMHLINGTYGIGSGWSSRTPKHNPMDVAFWFQQRLLQVLDPEHSHQLPLIRPWYKGFTGEIKMKKDGFTTEGRMLAHPNGSVEITELPIGTWTNDYEEYLASLEEAEIITGFDTFSTATNVRFVIHKYNDGKPTLKKLKLINTLSYKNMTVLYRTPDRGIHPKIYNNLNDLMEDFFKFRLQKYQERKNLMVAEIEGTITDLSEKARYIHEVAVTKNLEVRNRKKAEIYTDMDRLKLDHKWLSEVKTLDLSEDQIPVLQAKIQEKINVKAQLEQIRPEQIWYVELEEFVTRYCREEKCQRSTLESCNPTVTLQL